MQKRLLSSLMAMRVRRAAVLVAAGVLALLYLIYRTASLEQGGVDAELTATRQGGGGDEEQINSRNNLLHQQQQNAPLLLPPGQEGQLKSSKSHVTDRHVKKEQDLREAVLLSPPTPPTPTGIAAQQQQDYYAAYHDGTKSIPCTVRPAILPHTPRHTLPVFVFVAGIEGCGHHAIEDVLIPLQAMAKFALHTVSPDLHPYVSVEEIDGVDPYVYPALSLAEYRVSVVRYLVSPEAANHSLIVDAIDSFPTGPAGNVVHPDLLYLAMLDGDVIDLRVLVLYRSPADSVMSTVRRFGKSIRHKNYEYQARSAEASLAYLNNALPHLPCGKTRFLRFEDFIADPEAHVDVISTVMGVDSALVTSALAKAKIAKKKRPETTATNTARKMLAGYFEGKGQVLWPYLESGW